MKNEMVEILLSTFNGEKYIKEQIESIVNQTYSNWRLIIRDDCSTDSTRNIISEFVERFPQKIILKPDNLGNLGFKKSFMKLLEYSSGDYIMFCDQDDYWLENKIENQLSIIKLEENKDGVNKVPRLICCDLSICNEKLEVKVPSFFNQIKYKINKGQQSTLLLGNLHGCCFIFNKALLDISKNIKNNLNGHDLWLVLICSVIGKISISKEVLVKHRIHDSNESGFSEILNKNLSKKFSIIIKTLIKYCFNNKAYRKVLYNDRINQTAELIFILRNQYPDIIKKQFLFFCKLNTSNYFIRKYYNCFYPYVHFTSWVERLIYICCF